MTEFPAVPAPNNSVAVQPKGRINMAVAQALRHELADLINDGNVRVVVNLVDVETIDSSAIGALIGALKLARQAGGDVRIVAPSVQASEVLRMTNLNRLLPAYPSVESAFDQ